MFDQTCMTKCGTGRSPSVVEPVSRLMKSINTNPSFISLCSFVRGQMNLSAVLANHPSQCSFCDSIIDLQIITLLDLIIVFNLYQISHNTVVFVLKSNQISIIALHKSKCIANVILSQEEANIFHSYKHTFQTTPKHTDLFLFTPRQCFPFPTANSVF